MRTLLVLLFTILFISPSFSQDTYDKAIDLLNRGDFFGSREILEKVPAGSSSYENTQLSLLLIYIESGESEKAIEKFKDCMELTKNKTALLYAFLSSDVFDGEQPVKRQSRISFLESVLKNSNVDQWLKNEIKSTLRYHYRNDRDFKTSESYRLEILPIQNWQVAGPFNNTMNSGFKKDFGVLGNPSKDAIFKGKYGSPIGWHTPPSTISQYFLASAHFIESETLFYAQTFLQSENIKDVILHLSYSGVLKMWVNDVLVYEEEEERNYPMDYLKFKCSLNEGYNRVLIQLGEELYSNSKFCLRVTDSNLQPVDLKVSAEYQDYEKGKSKIDKISSSLTGQLKNWQKDSNRDWLSMYFTAKTLINQRNFNEAQVILEEFLESYPRNYPMLKLAQALYAFSGNETEDTKIQGIIQEHFPESFLVIKKELDEAVKTQDKTKIKKNVAIYRERYENPFLLELMDFYEDIFINENVSALGDFLDFLNSVIPHLSEGVRLKYNHLKQNKGDQKQALKFLKKEYEATISPDIVFLQADAYFETGKPEMALEVLDEAAYRFNTPINSLKRKVTIYNKLEQYENAIKECNRILEFRPTDYKTLNDIGLLYKYMQKPEQAKEYFEKVLMYYPFDVSVHNSLREVSDLKPVKDLMTEINPLEVIKEYNSNFKATTLKPFDFVYDQKQAFLFSTSASAFSFSRIYKINTEEAINDLQHLNFNFGGYYNTVVNDAYTLKEDGRKIDAEMNGLEAVYQNLEIGDYVYYNYNSQQKSGALSSLFFDDRYEFTSEYPVYKSLYEVYVDPSREFQYELLNTDLKPSVNEFEGFQRYSWVLNTPTVMEYEKYSPNYNDIASSVRINNASQWSDIAKWYRDLTESQIQSDVTIKNIVKELFPNTNYSDEEKARIIYDFILENIQYSSIDFRQSNHIPQRARDTYNSRLGDCKDVSALYTAIAREVGLKSQMVLINTSDNGEQNVVLPSINFNHCIVKVGLEEKPFYLELTDPYLPFGQMYYYHLGSAILDIPAEPVFDDVKLKRLDFNITGANTVVRSSECNIADEMTVTCNVLKTGTTAADITRNYLKISEDDQKKGIKESLNNYFENDVTISALVFESMKQRKDTVKYSYDFTVASPYNKMGSFKSIKVPFTDLLVSNNVLQEDERVSAFMFDSYEDTDLYADEIILNLEEGNKFIEVPDAVSHSFDGSTYNMTFEKLDANSIKVNRVYRPSRKRIAAKDYADFKEFVKKVLESEDTYLLFK